MLLSKTCTAQVSKLDSMNAKALRSPDYSMTQELFEHKYGYGAYNNEIIPLYFNVRRKAHYQVALAAPLATLGILGISALANGIKNTQLHSSLILVTFIPLLGFGGFYTFNGIKESIRFTKKRLLQDLIHYKQTGIPSRQIQDYIDTEIN